MVRSSSWTAPRIRMRAYASNATPLLASYFRTALIKPTMPAPMRASRSMNDGMRLVMFRTTL